MHVRLDPSSRVPLSAQLRAELARRIERGRLAPGERLPPVRELAAELSLAANTVARAYRELEAVGLLEGRGRHGTFVAERLPDRSGTEARLAEAAETFVRRAHQLGAGRAATERAVRAALERRRG